MKCHLTVLAVSLGTLLLTALSTGSPIFLMAAILLVVILVLSLVSVLWAAKTTQIHCLLSGQSVRRGDTVSLTIQVQCGCPLPIAPILLELAATPDTPETQLRMTNLRGRGQTVTLPFHAVHVGVTSPGVNRYVVEDLFGLFSISREPDIRSREMLVLPMTFEVDELKFSSGDAGSEIMHKATEDINAPADVRSYQPGDPLKKIHWKLSLRKNELMVRRFEEPVLPDALVLMDCSPPPTWGHPEAEADIRDTLLETAASVVARQIRHDGSIRLPLQGNHPMEFEKAMGMPTLLEQLARLDFSETDRFERVLLLETRRMRKTGCTVIITARLNGNIVDVIIRMRRMGPYVRLYLVTFTPNDPRVLPLISRLQQASVEVCYVSPQGGGALRACCAPCSTITAFIRGDSPLQKMEAASFPRVGCLPFRTGVDAACTGRAGPDGSCASLRGAAVGPLRHIGRRLPAPQSQAGPGHRCVGRHRALPVCAGRLAIPARNSAGGCFTVFRYSGALPLVAAPVHYSLRPCSALCAEALTSPSAGFYPPLAVLLLVMMILWLTSRTALLLYTLPALVAMVVLYVPS